MSLLATKSIISEANSIQVKSEVAKRLKASMRALQDLGTKRQTQWEQNRYLVAMSMAFQNFVTEALAADYGRHKMFMDNPSLRIVTAAVNRSEDMAKMIDKQGHTYRFAGRYTYDTMDAVDLSLSMSEIADRLATSPVRQYLEPTAVDDLIPNTSEVEKTRPGRIFDWLRTVYRDSRGYEIGTVNPTLLATIMREQARKWEDIAYGYIADIIVLTHNFINQLLHEVCPTPRVREGILRLLRDGLCTRYQAAINHVKFLLDVDLDGTPSKLNHYFNDNLQKWYVRRALQDLAR